jgi:hypothetical protein
VPEAGAGLGFAGTAGFDAFPRLSRGGASLSLLSRPTGTFSALWVAFATSVPFGK